MRRGIERRSLDSGFGRTRGRTGRGCRDTSPRRPANSVFRHPQGDPTGPQPDDGAWRAGSPSQVPGAGPGRQVHGRLRQRLPRRRSPDHPDTDSSTTSQRLRRALRRHDPSGVPRPDTPRGRLEVILTEYVDHYNTHRPHRSFKQASPLTISLVPPPISSPDADQLRKSARLGGLIHEYQLAA